jgi:hypothetical protein
MSVSIPIFRKRFDGNPVIMTAATVPMLYVLVNRYSIEMLVSQNVGLSGNGGYPPMAI